MLGPMKKKMIATGIIAFLIPCIIFGLIFYFYNSGKNNQIAELNKKVADTERYVFSGDFSVNHVVGMNDVKLAGVKTESAALNTYNALQLSELIGRKLKIAVKDKTIITSNMFLEEEDNVEKDVRTKEFNMITLPSDLTVDDYVDIRILFPTGEDFVVIAGKEIKQLGVSTDSNTIFLDLSEEELLRLSSAIIESYISDSVYLYAVKYVKPYQQLFHEETVDFVAKYDDAVYRLLEELNNKESDANISGEKHTEAELSLESIATKAGMNVNDVEAIRNARKNNDESLLAKYKGKTVITKTELVENYPVKKEVAAIIANNPNIVDSLRKQYNIEELERRKATLIDTSIYERNEYTGEVTENSSALSSIASRLSQEIETQKTERREYLQSLIRNSMIGE